MLAFAATPTLGFPASWNVSRCIGGFNVYVHLDKKALSGPLAHKWHKPQFRSLWEPQPDVPRATSPFEACVVVVPLGTHAWASGQKREQLGALPHEVPNWSGGRNVILIDQSDVPINAWR